MHAFARTTTSNAGRAFCKRWRFIISVALIVLVALLAAAMVSACSGVESNSTSTASNTSRSSATTSYPSESASISSNTSTPQASEHVVTAPQFDYSSLPAYDGKPSIEINNNVPFFSESDLSRESFETYSALDSLGRCGPAFALVGPETMPTEQRGSIGAIKPSGWQISTYDWIDGRYLYNRCHLIAFALASENDNELNLITGTRSMNTLGMLPLEEQVASYIDRTKNHVLYRVTPVFEGNDLVARGVLMEAQSIEDDGAGIRACIWCYNVEPGVTIDYATGDNCANGSKTDVGIGAVAGMGSSVANGSEGDGESENERESGNAIGGETTQQTTDGEVRTYILNTNSNKFHYPDCKAVLDMAEKNKKVVEATRDEIINEGYKPCGICRP